MGNENNQFTESDWVCAIVYITVVFWPFVLAILLMAMDFRLLCIFFPVSVILVLAMILDDGTPLIKRTRKQPPPKLSKWEEKKKAESLYKFP